MAQGLHYTFRPCTHRSPMHFRRSRRTGLYRSCEPLRRCTRTPERERLHRNTRTREAASDHNEVCGEPLFNFVLWSCGATPRTLAHRVREEQEPEGPSWSTSRGGFELWGQGATVSLAQDVSKDTRGQSCYSGWRGADEVARNPPRLVQLDPRASQPSTPLHGNARTQEHQSTRTPSCKLGGPRPLLAHGTSFARRACSRSSKTPDVGEGSIGARK